MIQRIMITIAAKWNEGLAEAKHVVSHPTLSEATAENRRAYIELTDYPEGVSPESGLGRCIDAGVPIAIKQTNPSSRFYAGSLTNGQVISATLEELFPEKSEGGSTGLSSDAIRRQLMSLIGQKKIKNAQAFDILMLASLREMREAYATLVASLG
jgi:hypothetical protein